MKNAVQAVFTLIAMLGATTPLRAATVHPFEAPPTLSEPGPRLAPQALGGAPAPCNPQGSMSRNGSIVSVELDFVLADFKINNPDPTDPQPNGEDPVRLRSYGGCKSGPVIDVRPGDTLRVDLRNGTDKSDPSCWDNPPTGLSLPFGVGCFNTTNLHTHGLHVSPAGNSDNVLLNIAPQSRFPYEINIPSDHPAGTFWYHAHRHGSTAVNVASGASGVILIRGNRPYAPPTPANPHPIADIDTVLHTAAGVPLTEQVFLFQQIAYACFAVNPNDQGGPWQQLYTSAGLYNVNSSGPSTFAPWTCPLSTTQNPVSPGAVENFALQLDSPTIWDTNGRFTSINGVVQPTITLPAGRGSALAVRACRHPRHHQSTSGARKSGWRQQSDCRVRAQRQSSAAKGRPADSVQRDGRDADTAVRNRHRWVDADEAARDSFPAGRRRPARVRTTCSRAIAATSWSRSRRKATIACSIRRPRRSRGSSTAAARADKVRQTRNSWLTSMSGAGKR